MILDHWVWPEYADGQALMPGIDVAEDTSQEEKNAIVTEVFEDYPEVVCCREWQQHDSYQGLQGPVNVLLQTWERHAFYFAESVEQALAQKGV